jgi:flagellin
MRPLQGAHIRNGKIPMTMNSINTNAQSLIALQNLNSTNAQMSVIQKRVSTGYRVADARDDGGAFAVAQSVKSDMAGVVAVTEQLGGVKGILETTFAALSVVSDTMKQIRATLTRLADAAINSDQRTAYQQQYTLLAKQVESFVDDAGYNGRTLLSTAAIGNPAGGNITAIRNESGGLFTIEAVDGDVLKLDPDAFPPQPAPAAFEAAIKAQLGVELGTADPVVIDAAFALLTPAQKQTRFDDNKIRDELATELAAADPIAWTALSAAAKATAITSAFAALTPAQRQGRIDARVQGESLAQAQAWIQSGGAFDVAETAISTALNKFGASMAFVESQITYNSKKSDAMSNGLGALVDADLARESSALEGIKVRQQLGVQTLSLANQGPQVLLGLFRN